MMCMFWRSLKRWSKDYVYHRIQTVRILSVYVSEISFQRGFRGASTDVTQLSCVSLLSRSVASHYSLVSTHCFLVQKIFLPDVASSSLRSRGEVNDLEASVSGSYRVCDDTQLSWGDTMLTQVWNVSLGSVPVMPVNLVSWEMRMSLTGAFIF